VTKYVCEVCGTESCILESNDRDYLPTDFPEWCNFKMGKKANFVLMDGHGCGA